LLRKLLLAGGVLVLLVLAIVAVGYALPVAHVASAERSLPHPAEKVYAAITDVTAFPQWRDDVKSVDVLNTTPLRWRERMRDMNITLEVVDSSPPSRLVSRIADPELPFGGTWTYELAADASGTRLTITERGEVYNPLFRFMSRFVFGHTATMEQFLEDLQKRLESR